MMAGLIFMVATTVGMIAALLVGIPLTRVLSRRRLEGVWVYTLAGAVTGIVTTFVVTGGWIGGADSLASGAWGAIPGGTTGLIWWFDYRRHFQDRGETRG